MSFMPTRQDQKTEPEDASQAALRAVEKMTGTEPVEDASEDIADPETRRKYEEIMEKERARKNAEAV